MLTVPKKSIIVARSIQLINGVIAIKGICHFGTPCVHVHLLNPVTNIFTHLKILNESGIGLPPSLKMSVMILYLISTVWCTSGVWWSASI